MEQLMLTSTARYIRPVADDEADHDPHLANDPDDPDLESRYPVDDTDPTIEVPVKTSTDLARIVSHCEHDIKRLRRVQSAQSNAEYDPHVLRVEPDIGKLTPQPHPAWSLNHQLQLQPPLMISLAPFSPRQIPQCR